MPSSLIRGKYVVCKGRNRTEADIVEDGAVFQRDGKIVEIGKYADLAKKHATDETLGSDAHVVLPGLVNAHHHVGLTPVQLGSRDQPLELWFVTRLYGRAVDLYLDTLYSAFEMIESGVTTVQHLNGWFPNPLSNIRARIDRILQAYADIGMRVSFTYGTRDQCRLVYQDDAEFIRSLPPDLGADLKTHLDSVTTPLDEQLRLFEDLRRDYAGRERVRIQLSPMNLHWCTDGALERLREASERFDAPMHMHVVESAHQKEYARRRTGGTAVAHLHKLGLLGPRMTMGHSVWLTEADIELAAATGTNICTNASSNLRLRSGIAPLNELERRGVTVAMGMDEAGINDDRDMLTEMHLLLHLHRTPGFGDAVPTPAQVLRIATENGARTTAFGTSIGTLEPGKGADMVLLDWRQIAEPFLDLTHDLPLLDAIIYRAKTSGVDSVVVAGEAVYRDRRFTRVDKDAILRELARHLQRPMEPDELFRRGLSQRLFPHVKAFYDGYLDRQEVRPFYSMNSRV